MCESECKCKPDSKNMPIILGGIAVYELAIIITLLVFIYLDFNDSLNEATNEVINETVND